jgi:hypothetical protein
MVHGLLSGQGPIVVLSWDLQAEAEEVRFEVFTAVTTKNVVLWDIKPQFVLHRRHITSPLKSIAS